MKNACGAIDSLLNAEKQTRMVRGVYCGVYCNNSVLLFREENSTIMPKLFLQLFKFVLIIALGTC